MTINNYDVNKIKEFVYRLICLKTEIVKYNRKLKKAKGDEKLSLYISRQVINKNYNFINLINKVINVADINPNKDLTVDSYKKDVRNFCSILSWATWSLLINGVFDDIIIKDYLKHCRNSKYSYYYNYDNDDFNTLAELYKLYIHPDILADIDNGYIRIKKAPHFSFSEYQKTINDIQKDFLDKDVFVDLRKVV